jgi:hypothetical protein
MPISLLCTHFSHAHFFSIQGSIQYKVKNWKGSSYKCNHYKSNLEDIEVSFKEVWWIHKLKGKLLVIGEKIIKKLLMIWEREIKNYLGVC